MLTRTLAWTAGAWAGLALDAGRARAAPGAPALRTRPIPSTGEVIPAIGLGTWQTFDVTRASAGAAGWSARREVLERFFAAGGRLIDSSPMYGHAEASTGALRRELGDARAFLASKVWIRGRDRGIEQMRASMRKMGARRMDLMQVHNLLDWKTHLDTLRAWKAEGRIRYLGVTHYQLDAFDELERIIARERLDFVQIPYSIAVRQAERRLLPAAAASGTAVLVMRPFEGGSLFRRVRGKALPAWAAEIDCTSWAQLFLKFILGHPHVTCPIPATSKPAHLDDNMRAGRGRLPDARMRERMYRILQA